MDLPLPEVREKNSEFVTRLSASAPPGPTHESHLHFEADVDYQDNAWMAWSTGESRAQTRCRTEWHG